MKLFTVKFSTLIFAIVLINIAFAQDSIKVDSGLIIKSDFELTYSISNGNVYTFRLLKEGIIVKRFFIEKSKVETKFIPLKNINYKEYNKIQNFIDSINLIKYKPLYNDTLIFRSGFQTSLELTNNANNEFVFINNLDNLSDKNNIISLVKLLNSVLPKKYQKKFKIYGWY
jgi:hypothetical protein